MINDRTLVLGLLMFSVTSLAGVVWYFNFARVDQKRFERSKPLVVAVPTVPVAPSEPDESPPDPLAKPPADPPSQKDQSTFRARLEQILSKFKSLGSGPHTAYLDEELASGDKIRIQRVFDELVYHSSPSDSIPAIRTRVNDPDLYIRFLAAKSLLTEGDGSGVASLAALVKSDHPIDGFGEKDGFRIGAACLLAQYHQTAAVDAIVDLYSKTHAGKLSESLANLGVKLPGEDQLPFIPYEGALIEYAQSGTTRFIPQITALFQKTSKLPLKAAAAWSLATMTGDQAATAYLIDKARSGLDKANQEDALHERENIKYVGTLQTPEAKQTLAAALDSSDPVVAQTAVVNLLYNQGRSDWAIQKIAEQLNDPAHATLPWEFTFDVASKLLDDARIQSAGRRFSKRDVSQMWRRFVVEHRNWPSENWIGDWMIQVNNRNPAK